VRDILTETIAKAGGGQVKLQEIFGEEGIRGISPLISAFNEGKSKSKGKTEAERTADGVNKLRDALDKAIEAPGDWSEIVEDSAAAQKTAGAQLDAAWESVKAAVAQEAVPAILKLAPALSSIADTVLPPVLTTFVALAEAAGDVVDVLKEIGILKTKRMTPEEQLKKAKADLDTYNKKVGSGINDTAAERAQRMRLIAAVDTADKAVYTTTNVAKGDGGKNAQPLMTEAEFAKKYVEAANPMDLNDEDKRSAIEDKARALAASLAKDPADAMASNDWLQGLSGETEEQKRARQQFQADTTAGQMRGDGAGAADLSKAAAELTAAARALQNGQRTGGSIVGDTQ